jgi:hypothetical protein
MNTYRRFIGLFLVLGLILVSSAAWSEDPPPPSMAPDGFEPEVTIIDKPTGKIEEFRANGQLYMIKVHPKKGKPYFLVDADGDGQLETRTNELAPDLLIPSWVLFSW